MEFGVQVSNTEWQQLKDYAQAVEELGYDLITVPDHLVAEGPERQFDPRHLLYDPIAQAAVLSEVTRKIRIGHLVLCNLFRHPAVTAKAIASLDQLSGGRLYAGLGSGWTQREFDQTGIAFPDIEPRLRMLDEALTCMRKLWADEEADFAGEFYTLRKAVSWPKPLQKPHPPILLGGGGRGLLRIAARHADIVNIISDSGKPGYISMKQVARLTDQSFRSKVKFLREQAARQGRDGARIRISNVVFSCVLTASPQATLDAAAAVAPMFHTTAEALLQSPLALIGTPEEITAELQRRAGQWQIDQFIFSNLPLSSARQLAENVLPRVR